ncbi:MAG: hypothetical protein FJ279_00500 [Planctomycetes bacterium]|nr:hypothetical protein [Planctomycetota bacterium]
MDLSITFCRAIAALVIANAHFQHVCPWPILASGALLGNVISSAVSSCYICEIRELTDRRLMS